MKTPQSANGAPMAKSVIRQRIWLVAFSLSAGVISANEPPMKLVIGGNGTSVSSRVKIMWCLTLVSGTRLSGLCCVWVVQLPLPVTSMYWAFLHRVSKFPLHCRRFEQGTADLTIAAPCQDKGVATVPAAMWFDPD
jgi:hypothetical protein